MRCEPVLSVANTVLKAVVRQSSTASTLNTAITGIAAAEKQSFSSLTVLLQRDYQCSACALPELDYYVVVREAKERQKGTNDSIDDTHIQSH